MYNDDDELIGINKTICSKIRMTLDNSDIDEITFYIDPDGDIFPEKDLPLNSRKLKGFIWRGDERIMTKDDIFDEDDNNIELVKIRGVDHPLDSQEEENGSDEGDQGTLQQNNKAIFKEPGIAPDEISDPDG